MEQGGAAEAGRRRNCAEPRPAGARFPRVNAHRGRPFGKTDHMAGGNGKQGVDYGQNRMVLYCNL